jgi:hypothetical protein
LTTAAVDDDHISSDKSLSIFMIRLKSSGNAVSKPYRRIQSERSPEIFDWSLIFLNELPAHGFLNEFAVGTHGPWQIYFQKEGENLFVNARNQF